MFADLFVEGNLARNLSGFVHKAWESVDTRRRERLKRRVRREKLEAEVFHFTIFLLLVLIENSIGVRAKWTILRELEIS